METEQQMGCDAKPQKEHEWLNKLIGDWTYEGEMACQPGETPMKASGTETVRSVGGFWVVGEGRGTIPGGGDATTYITLGYDPSKERYVGSWFGSMMGIMFFYDGELDAAEKTLTLETEGPDFFTPGQRARYRDVIEFVSDDHRVLRSQIRGDDGAWTEFMTAHYRRKQ